MSGAVGPTGRNETEGMPCDGGSGAPSVVDISAYTRKWGGDLVGVLGVLEVLEQPNGAVGDGSGEVVDKSEVWEGADLPGL